MSRRTAGWGEDSVYATDAWFSNTVKADCGSYYIHTCANLNTGFSFPRVKWMYTNVFMLRSLFVVLNLLFKGDCSAYVLGLNVPAGVHFAVLRQDKWMTLIKSIFIGASMRIAGVCTRGYLAANVQSELRGVSRCASSLSGVWTYRGKNGKQQDMEENEY